MPKISTKAACVRALAAIHPDAKLNEDSDENCYDVEIEAPHFYSWGGLSHIRVINWYNCGNKGNFWAEVLNEIKQLPKLESCNPNCDVECIGGTCEYWAENDD